MSKCGITKNLNQQSYSFHHISDILENNSSRYRLIIRIIRWNSTVFQLSLGVRHLKKITLGTANNFNLGTKTRYLQYTVTANQRRFKSKKRQKIEKKRRENKRCTYNKS